MLDDHDGQAALQFADQIGGDTVNRSLELSVEAGARHFVACLAGTETPVLTAVHARHVLEVILAAYASIADGRIQELRTTFAWP